MASSKRIQFFKGTKVKYDELINDRNKESIIKNGIYFCTDRKTIMTQGLEFGGFDTTIFDGVVMNLKVKDGVLTYDTVEKGQTVNKKTTLTLVTNRDNSINVEHNTDGGVNVSVKVKPVIAGEDGIKVDTDGLYVDLTNTDAKIVAETNARTAAIQGMSLASTGGAGKYITTIAQANGKVTATAADLTATAVSYDKTGDKVIAKATDVSAAIKELDVKVAANKDAELTYKAVKLADEEVTALGDVNVKEAYKVVSVNKEGTKATVGDIIKIYKDSSLVSIDYTETDDKKNKGQFLKYVYTLADGTQKTVYVDMSKLVDQAEVENGIQAIDGKLSIKVAEGNEADFLTVDANGLKLSGVQAAIANAKNEVIDGASAGYNTLKGLEDKIGELDTKVQNAHTVVNEKADGHITVTVTNSEDSTHKVVTIRENDIASQNALKAEVTRAKGKEQELSGQIASIESTKAGKFEVRGGEHIEVVNNPNGEGGKRQITISAVDLATSTDLNALSNTVDGHTASIGTLNGDVNTAGSVANAVKKAKDTLQNSIDAVQQTANKNATDIQSLKPEVAKANAIVVNGGTNIEVGLTNGTNGHKIFTVSNTASKTDRKVANNYVTSVSQSNGVITVERAQPDAKEIKYTKAAESTSSIVGKTVHEALEEIDHDLQWIDAGTYE